MLCISDLNYRISHEDYANDEISYRSSNRNNVINNFDIILMLTNSKNELVTWSKDIGAYGVSYLQKFILCILILCIFQFNCLVISKVVLLIRKYFFSKFSSFQVKLFIISPPQHSKPS